MNASRATALRTSARNLLLAAAAPGALIAAMAVAPAATAQTVGPGTTTNAGAITDTVVMTGANPTFSGAMTNTAATPDVSTITLNSSRTILNWSNFNLTDEDTLQYVFAANTDIALNRVGAAATISGQLYGCLGACNALGAGGTPTNFGGNVWLLSSDGIMITTGARVNAGGLLFGTGDITNTDFFNSNFNFLNNDDSGIDVQSGVDLTASNGALTVVAPLITFAGNAISSGSIALIGARDVSITFDAEMDAYLNITVAEGSGAPASQDTITVTGAASFNAAAPASQGRTYIIAASNGTGLGSIVLGGTAADRVEFDEGDVVLYAAGNVTSARAIVADTNSDGIGDLQPLGSATGLGSITIGAANVDIGSLDVRAVDDVLVNDAVSVSGNARFEAGEQLTISTAVTTGGDYTIRAGDFMGAAVFTPNEGADINIEDTGGGLAIGNVTATDDLRITTENGDLNVTGGPVTASGGSVFLTVNNGIGGTLALNGNVVDTGADDTVTLVSSGSISQGAGAVITAGALTGSAGTSATLAQRNLIGTLAGFTTGSGLTLNDEGNLTISGVVTGGTGAVTIDVAETGAGTAADLAVNAAITGTGVTLTAERNLNAAGAINGGSGGVSLTATTGTLTTNTGSPISATGGVIALTGAAVTLGGATITGPDVDVTGPTTINGANIINAGAGGAEFANTIVGGAGATDTLTINLSAGGQAEFNGDVGVGATLESLEVDGGGTILNSLNVITSGNLRFDAVTVGPTAPGGTLNLQAGGTLRFDGALNNNATARDLTLTGTGSPGIFVRDVGTGNPFASIDFNGVTRIDSTIISTGTNEFNSDLILGDGSHLIQGANNEFDGTINAANAGLASLTVTATPSPPGTNTFSGSIGNTGRLSSLTVNGASSFSGTVVNTTGLQAFNSGLTLTGGGTSTFDSSASGNITFGGTLDGADAVAVNTAGTTTFSGVVGGTTALTSLTTDSAGTTAINTIGITTTGTQTYNDAVALGATTTLTSTGGAALTFASTLNGAFGLTVNTSGATTFGGAVGGTTALASLTTNAGGTTAVNGGSVTTSGDQSYGDAVSIDEDTTFTGVNGSFFSLDGNGNDVTLNFSGTTAIGSNFTDIDNLSSGGGGTTSLSGSITTTGAQTYFDAVTLTGATTLTSSGDANIRFASTVNGGFGLAVGTAGDTIFDGIVGGTTPLASLSTDPTGNTVINGGVVNTTGDQDYDNVVLGAATVLTGANTTSASIAGGGFNLTLNFSGVTDLNGVTAVANLDTDAAGSTDLSGTISTTGTQLYRDAVTLGGATTLTSSGAGAAGDITLASTVDGVQTLAVNTAGTTTFGGAVGSGLGTALVSLTTDAAGSTAINGGAITTTGLQQFSDAVTLGGAGNVTLNGGATVTFGSTVNGPRGLTVNTPALTTFTGAVGGADNTTALAFLTVNGPGVTAINGGSVRTTGDQTYGDDVTLGADTTLTGANSSFANVNGNNNDLALNFTGATAIGSNFTNINDLSSGGTGTTSLSGTITTTGTQTYTDFVTLAGATVLTSSGAGAAGNINLASTVNGANTLTVTTAGTTTFGGDVGGSTALASLATNGGGSTVLNAGVDVTTTLGQTYGEPLVLGSGMHALTASTASFQTVDGATPSSASLLVSTPGGATTFSGAVGGAASLEALGVRAGTATFTGTNNVETFAADVTAGGVNFQNGASLTVGSVTDGSTTVTGVTAGAGSIRLATTAGDLALNQNVTDTGADETVTLESAGTITQGGGALTAGTLTGSSVGGATLTQAGNQIGFLGAFTNAGLGGITIDDSAGGLTISGAVSGGSGGVNVETTGGLSLVASGSVSSSSNGPIRLASVTAGDVNLAGNVNAGDGTLTLTAAGAVGQTTGVLTAGTLTGSAGTTTTLTGANLIDNLGNYGSTGGAFSLTNAQTLNLSGELNATGQTATLNVTGDITQAEAVSVLRAGTLTGSSTGATTLDGANQLASLGAFNGGSLALNDLGGLNVTGAVTGATGVSITTSDGPLTVATGGSVAVTTSGGLTLTTINSGGPSSGAPDVVLNGAVNNVGRTVTLTSAGGVSQNAAGVITAGTLTGSSAGTTALATATNAIDVLGPYTANGLSLLDAGGLTVGGAVNGGAGGVALQTSGDLTVNAAVSSTNAAIGLTATGAGSDIALNQSVNAGTGTVTLTANGAAGTISQNASGVITAGTLTGGSNGATSLASATNQVTNLGTFSANGFTLLDAGGLTVTGAVAGGAGGLTLNTSGDLTVNAGLSTTNAAIGLTTTGSGSDIALNATVNSGTGTTTLTSAATITQGTAGITAANLTGSAVGSATLEGANQVTNLAGFTANGFRFADAGGLTVTGAVNGGAGGVSLDTSGDLAVNAGVSASNAAVALTASGAGSDISLAAPVNAGTGTVTLTAGATISQTAAGQITGATLTGSSGGATTLTAATNQLTNLGAFTANGLALVDGGGLTVAGAVSGGAGGVNVQTSGDLTVNAGVSSTNAAIALTATGAGSDIALNAGLGAGTGTVTLTANGAGATISQNASGTIVAGTLTGSSDGATSLASASNNVTNLDAFSANGFSFLDAAGNLNIVGAVNARAGSAIIASAGDLITTATGSVAADTDISLAAGGALTARDLAAIDIVLQASGAATAGTLNARDDVAIQAGGAVVTGAITSGATIAAGGPVDRTGLADALLGPLPGHDIDITGQSVTTGQLRANGSGSDIRINAGAGGTGSATTDLSITAGGDIVLTGTARGVDVALNSGGSITTGAVTARDDIVFRAGTTVTAGQLSAGVTVSGQPAVDQSGAGDALAAANTISAPASAALLHTGAADVSVKAGGDVTLNGVSAQRDIAVETGTIARLNGATNSTTGSLLTIARDVRMAGTANLVGDMLLYSRSAQVTVGGATADASDLFNFSSAEIDRTTARSVNVFGGLQDGGSAPITVNNLTLASDMPTLRVFTTGDVTVPGTISGDAGSAFVVGATQTNYTTPTPGSAADRPTFQVGTRSWEVRTGWTPATVRITGVLGDGPSDWLGLVSLTGGSVLIFPAQDPALASVGGFEEAARGPDGEDPARLFAYSGNVSQQVVADTFAIRASGEILQRNLDTAVPGSTAGRGLIAGRLFVESLTDGGTVPTRMSLFGSLAADLNGLSPTTTLVDGPAAATLVRDEGAGASASVRFNAPPGTYRFNGCEIGTGGGCLTVRVDPSLPPIDAISSIGNLLDRFATIEDEPVTSTGIELFWFARPDDEDEDDDDEEEEKK